MVGALGLQQQQVEALPTPLPHISILDERPRAANPLFPVLLMQKECLSCYGELCSDCHEPPRKPEGWIRWGPETGREVEGWPTPVVAAVLQVPQRCPRSLSGFSVANAGSVTRDVT